MGNTGRLSGPVRDVTTSKGRLSIHFCGQACGPGAAPKGVKSREGHTCRKKARCRALETEWKEAYTAENSSKEKQSSSSSWSPRRGKVSAAFSRRAHAHKGCLVLCVSIKEEGIKSERHQEGFQGGGGCVGGQGWPPPGRRPRKLGGRLVNRCMKDNGVEFHTVTGCVKDENLKESWRNGFQYKRM